MLRAGPGNQPTQKRPAMACNFIMSSLMSRSTLHACLRETSEDATKLFCCPSLIPAKRNAPVSNHFRSRPLPESSCHLQSTAKSLSLAKLAAASSSWSAVATCLRTRCSVILHAGLACCTNASCGARESALQGGISSCRSGGDGGKLRSPGDL